MKHLVRYALPGLLMLCVGAIVGMSLESHRSNPDALRQLRKLEDAYLIINQQYVDEVNADNLAESAIQGMLDKLDPHSSYVSAEELKEVQEGFQGSFGGVGIMFEVPDDTARVITTVANGPSEKAGIMPGDRIIAIDDSNAVGFSDDDIRLYLKGDVGTKVRVTMARPGVNKPLSFTITRGRIPIYTVDAAFMLDEQTGFIRINHFAQTTHDEFRDKMRMLMGQGMKRLVLDLRDNPGGVMRSAVGMADEMLRAGQTIVSTRSRNTQYNSTDRATSGGMFEDRPVIVLVNERSASASEIVSGALQDHDRALLVGRRTFGKGLVQAQFPLSDGSVLQMTISRYYTPVGRLIQTPYTKGEGFEKYYEDKYASLNRSAFNPADYIESVPDSLKFQTGHGRTVFGGGGILPDFVVVPDTALVLGVNNRALDFQYARKYFEENERRLRDTWGETPERFVRDFRVTPEMWSAFAETLKGDEGLTFTDDPEAVSFSEGVFLRSDLTEKRSILEARIKGYLARNLYGSEYFYHIVMPTDDVVKQAMELWGRAETLAMLTK